MARKTKPPGARSGVRGQARQPTRPKRYQNRGPQRVLGESAQAGKNSRDCRNSRRPPEASWSVPVSFGEYDLPPFPTEVLPKRIREFVDAEAEATQTPADLTACLVLAVVGASCAKKVEVHVREGWSEPVNGYFVVSLAIGNRKSPVFRDASRPIYDFEKEETRRWRRDYAAAKAARATREAELKTLRKEAASAQEGERRKLEKQAEEAARALDLESLPVRPQRVIDDATPEYVAKVLSKQRGRIAVFSAEGGIFELMGGRYGQQGRPNFEIFLKGHTGDSHRLGRISRDEEDVPKPAITMGLTVQPAMLEGLAETPGFVGRGLLARIFYSLPPSTVGSRRIDPPPVRTKVSQAYAKGISALLSLPEEFDRDGEPIPRRLNLLQEARQVLLEFAGELEPQLAPGDELSSLAGWASKLPGGVARLAGILHMVAHALEKAPWAIPISSETMRAGVSIGRYMIEHAKAAFGAMGMDPRFQGARHILAWIRRHVEKTDLWVFTKQEAWQGTKGHFKEVEPFNKGLELLVAHDYIKELPSSARGRGRPPAPSYEVNPRDSAYKSYNPCNPIRQMGVHASLATKDQIEE
jgi:replicative DNA helicase